MNDTHKQRVKANLSTLDYLEGTGVIGCVACSGLFHEDDHQVLVDAISGMLGIDLDA